MSAGRGQDKILLAVEMSALNVESTNEGSRDVCTGFQIHNRAVEMSALDIRSTRGQ
jgi:hypothetical protein